MGPEPEALLSTIAWTNLTSDSSYRTCDFLIAGGGLAGALLAWFLRERGADVLVADLPNTAAAWRTASGLLTPITGRHLARTYMLDTLLPFAKEFYRSMEQRFAVPLLAEWPVVRVFRTAEERALWEERRTEPGYGEYMQPASDGIPTGVHAPFGTGVMNGGGRVDLKALLGCLHSALPMAEHPDPMRTDELIITDNHVQWRNIRANTLVFCEGWRGASNPLFGFVPLQPSHGETLVIRTSGIPDDCILSGSAHVSPLGNGMYKVGATNRWTIFDEATTEKGLAELRRKLDSLLDVPYDIVEHTAGIRPAIKDRHPVAGMHPVHKQVGILNGLGSKGALYGPWSASHFADFLVYGTALPAFSIERFSLSHI